MSQKTRKMKRVVVWLDQDTIRTLQSFQDKLSLSSSSIVRQALHEYFAIPEQKEIAKKLQEISQDLLTELKIFEEHRIPELKSEIQELAYQIKQFNFKLDKLTEALEVVAFWGALISELIKVRLFNTKSLSQEEYERFKKLWYLAHERADARIESLLGKQVWKQKFDPEKNPLK